MKNGWLYIQIRSQIRFQPNKMRNFTMKRTALLIIISATAFLRQYAQATISFTATPSSPLISAGSGSFTVSLSLNVSQSSSPAYVQGYDLVFEALQSQNGGISNGQFNVTDATAASSGPASGWIRIASGTDHLTTVGSDHSGYVQTAQDEGFAGDNSAGQTAATPLTNFQLATYTFSYSGLTAGSIYNFGTTIQSTSSSKYSDVANDTSPYVYPADASANFSVVVTPNLCDQLCTVGRSSLTAVPEPATWLLFGLGTLAPFGLNLLRVRQKVRIPGRR
jgi:hypothetical protein